MKQILLIEDDCNLKGIIQEMLRAENYDVVQLNDGLTIGEVLTADNFDLVLCDIMLPGKNGYEILKDIKKEIPAFDIPPFIFLTAKTDRQDVRHGMELGADDYISKPFTRKELLTAIETQISKRKKILKRTEIEMELVDLVMKRFDAQGKKIPVQMTYDSTFFIDTDSSPKLLKVKDIEYITVESGYTNVITVENGSIPVRKPIKKWEQILPRNKFIRIHRGIIINYDYIVKIEKWFNYSYRVFLCNVKEPFIISQRYSRMLRQQIR